MPEVVKNVPHVAFAVDDLDEALEGKQILIPPTAPSTGVRVAFFLHDGAPVELLEFQSPRRPVRGRRGAAAGRTRPPTRA